MGNQNNIYRFLRQTAVQNDRSLYTRVTTQEAHSKLFRTSFLMNYLLTDFPHLQPDQIRKNEGIAYNVRSKKH